MLFYDDFVKKVLEKKDEKYGDIESFGLEIKKKAVWLGTGIPIFLIGLYLGYVGYLNNYKVINMLFALIFFYIGYKHIKNVVNYEIKIDNINDIIIYEGIEVKFSEIESCTLKEGSVGKKAEYCIILDVVTKEGKQYILPLMMNNKLKFVRNIKNRVGDNFKIIK